MNHRKQSSHICNYAGSLMELAIMVLFVSNRTGTENAGRNKASEGRDC
jgi:hypothetical protein